MSNLEWGQLNLDDGDVLAKLLRVPRLQEALDALGVVDASERAHRLSSLIDGFRSRLHPVFFTDEPYQWNHSWLYNDPRRAVDLLDVLLRVHTLRDGEKKGSAFPVCATADELRSHLHCPEDPELMQLSRRHRRAFHGDYGHYSHMINFDMADPSVQASPVEMVQRVRESEDGEMLTMMGMFLRETMKGQTVVDLAAGQRGYYHLGRWAEFFGAAQFVAVDRQEGYESSRFIGAGDMPFLAVQEEVLAFVAQCPDGAAVFHMSGFDQCHSYCQVSSPSAYAQALAQQLYRVTPKGKPFLLGRCVGFRDMTSFGERLKEAGFRRLSCFVGTFGVEEAYVDVFLKE